MSSVHLRAWPGNIWKSRLSLIIPFIMIVKTESLPSLVSFNTKTTHCILGRTMALLPTPSGLIITTQDPTPLMCWASEFIENTWKVQVVGTHLNVISHQFGTKMLISMTKPCIFQGSWRFNRSTSDAHIWISGICRFWKDAILLTINIFFNFSSHQTLDMLT